MIMDKAEDIIQEGEVAVVIFTHGIHFEYDAAWNGQTGKWVISPERLEEVDKVIVYLRPEGQSENRIFMGNYSGYKKSNLERRYIILFSGLKEIGTTNSNWFDFGNRSQTPICIVSKL